jgi:hypothetical protein
MPFPIVPIPITPIFFSPLSLIDASFSQTRTFYAAPTPRADSLDARYSILDARCSMLDAAKW